MDQADLDRLKANAHVTMADLEEAEARILADLKAVGVEPRDLWYLTDEAKRPEYVDAIPILIGYLDEEIPEKIKAQVARCLAVKAASPWWDELLRRFETMPDGWTREGLAVAVSEGFTKARLERLFFLIDDEAGGKDRVLFVRPLKRIRDPRVLPFLEERQDDPVLGAEIRRALAGRSRNS